MVTKFEAMQELSNRGALPEQYKAEFEALRMQQFDDVAMKEAAKKRGQIYGETRAKAEIDLPKLEDQGGLLIKQVEKLVNSPGFEGSVGLKNPLTGSFGFGLTVPGSPAADFKNLHDQIAGQQFLQAFETLKGGGQITQIEGQKATDAISRMKTNSSEREFRKAADEFMSVIRSGIDRARNNVRIDPSRPNQPRAPSAGNLGGGGRRLSPEQAAKLPSGTRFLSSDGRVMVRQ